MKQGTWVLVVTTKEDIGRIGVVLGLNVPLMTSFERGVDVAFDLFAKDVSSFATAQLCPMPEDFEPLFDGRRALRSYERAKEHVEYDG